MIEREGSDADVEKGTTYTLRLYYKVMFNFVPPPPSLDIKRFILMSMRLVLSKKSSAHYRATRQDVTQEMGRN